MEKSKTTKGKILRGGLSAAVLILTAALCTYLQWERAPEPTIAPERAEVLAVNRVLSEATPLPQPTETAPVSARRDGVYTLLLAGQDDGNANTDTLMVARLDSGEHRIDVVSIPRDTMINTAWKIRKINAAYAMGPYNNESGAASLSRQIARLTGFEPDCYAILDLDAFRQVIDAMGGVRFEVPMAMDYEDRSQGLSIPRKEAAEYIAAYFKTYPGIKAFLDRLVADARKNGYAETMYGRRRPVPELKSSNFMQRSFGERVAMNSPIQGTAADIMKIAMIRVWESLMREGLASRLILQIHDELLVENVPEEEDKVRKLLADEMAGAAVLEVALETDVHSGDDWYMAK